MQHAIAQSKSNENVAYVRAQQPNYINKRRKDNGACCTGYSLQFFFCVVRFGSKISSVCNKFRVLFTVLCFLYFVAVNQFCMSDFFTRLRQLYNLLTVCPAARGAWRGGRDTCKVGIAGCGSLSLFVAVWNEVKASSLCFSWIYLCLVCAKVAVSQFAQTTCMFSNDLNFSLRVHLVHMYVCMSCVS